MKIAFCSDLHIDIRDNELEWNHSGEVLCVAGDISNNVKVTNRFLNSLADRYHAIFFVDGNHEHYGNVGSGGRNLEEAKNILRKGLHENIHFLDIGRTAIYKDHRFIGCNSWYSMDFNGANPEDEVEYWQNYMNDYRCSWKGIDQPLPYELAKSGAEYLNAEILKEDAPCIVMTHTLPHSDFLYSKPWDPYWERAHSFFYNSHVEKMYQNQEIQDRVKIHHFGHTHVPFKQEKNGVRFICNPRGYPGERLNYDIVEVEI